MLNFIKKFFKPQVPGYQNHLYAQVLASAKLLAPQRFAIPSLTKEDRYAKFEVIALVMAYLMWQARADPDQKDRAILAMEAMFDDFDINLREQGVSDIRVGPEVRKLAAAFNGRQQRYFAAFEAKIDRPLTEALAHNWKVPPAQAKVLVKKLKTLRFSFLPQGKN